MEQAIKCSPFEAQFGRLSKNRIQTSKGQVKRDIKTSDHLDKKHLERSDLAASQLKRRVDQSRNNVKIVRKG